MTKRKIIGLCDTKIGMKLLLIDDDLTQSDWMRRRLESENNQVSVSTDWQMGWTMANQSRYDIVLLNVRLPETDYLDLPNAGQIKHYTLPLLVLISPDTPANKARGLEAGADDCVGCSVDFRELMARLNALYRRRVGHLTTPSALNIHVDDLELRLSEKAAYRGGKRINLLPREYYLLAFLMQNQGRVVSKKEILERVWNTSSSVRLNTVEVYINYLRNKIDRNAPTKLIHTVAGMGYVIRTISGKSFE